MLRICAVRIGSAAALAALGICTAASAGTIEVVVRGEDGKPIERVAVYATAADHATEAADAAAGGPPQAIMDQKALRFAPHVLVVQSGTSVTFPNSDDVSHHVYSFSDSKSFELPLYKGDKYPPVVFDQAGIVVLGCNIHDSMLGYIVVVDTPHFGVTDDNGMVHVDDVPDGDYVLQVWTPRVRPTSLPAAQRLTVTDGAAAAEVRITGRLAPDHEHGTSSLTWDRY
jgi:plastocyanin